jgi:hypothetical protein
MDQMDLKNLERDAVYPGHQITLAYLITRAFPTFESAFIKSKDNGWGSYAAALGSSRIPGAGGCVSDALGLLRKLRQGTPIEQAFKEADDTWERVDSQVTAYPKRWKEGQEQADLVKPLLMSQAAWWTP